MAPLLISRAPQCVSCIRRVAQLSDAIVFPAGQQIRGKKRTTKIPTVDVQLLQNVPGYGRKGSIVPVTRGIMRNTWFPRKIAEYVTSSRLQELKKEDIVPERDTTFGSKRERKAELAAAAEQVEKTERAGEAAAELLPAESAPQERASTGLSISPQEATAIVDQILPRNFDFYRVPIVVQPAKGENAEPAKKLSPSISAKSAIYAAATAKAQGTDAAGKETGTYGSVSTADIAESCMSELEGFAEADSINISPANISFVDEMEDKNRVKRLGKFAIEIKISGAEKAVPRTITVYAPVA